MSEPLTVEQANLEIVACCVCETECHITSENSGRYRLKDHCFACSGRVRSILSKPDGDDVKQWFKNLRKTDIAEYKKIVLAAQVTSASSGSASGQSSSSSNYLASNKFNLASYKEKHEQSRGTKLRAGFELFTWPWYKAEIIGRVVDL